MSYGTEPGVAALAKRYTNSGSFGVTTNPTLATVTAWLAQVSSMVDIALATAGFTTPITDASITPALDGFVNGLVADLVAAANTAGRFYTDKAVEAGVSPLKIINNDIRQWVEMMTPGLEALNAVRKTSDAGQIAYREADDCGNEVEHLFTRDQFGADR